MGCYSHIRKRLRLPEYDYSEKGVYYITFCTDGRKALLSRILPAGDDSSEPTVQLTTIGMLVDLAICQIPQHYPGIKVDHYVIMPNHVHMLLAFTGENNPKLGRVIQQLKGTVTKKCGKQVWQERYYDHIIRDETDYLTKLQYIHNNPFRWAEDQYYEP